MRVRLLVTLVLLAATVGCGGDDGKGGQPAGPPVQLAGSVNEHGQSDLSGAGATPEVEVELNDFYLAPTYVRVASGARVTVKLENEGAVGHTFTTTGVDTIVPPGKQATVTVTVSADPLVFYCRFHRGQGMQGAFYVVPGGTAAPDASSPTATKEGSDRY